MNDRIHEPDDPTGADVALQAAVNLRSAQRVAAMAPKYPATGTTRISELLASAREARDQDPRARLQPGGV